MILRSTWKIISLQIQTCTLVAMLKEDNCHLTSVQDFIRDDIISQTRYLHVVHRHSQRHSIQHSIGKVLGVLGASITWTMHSAHIGAIFKLTTVFLRTCKPLGLQSTTEGCGGAGGEGMFAGVSRNWRSVGVDTRVFLRTCKPVGLQSTAESWSGAEGGEDMLAGVSQNWRSFGVNTCMFHSTNNVGLHHAFHGTLQPMVISFIHGKVYNQVGLSSILDCGVIFKGYISRFLHWK